MSRRLFAILWAAFANMLLLAVLIVAAYAQAAPITRFGP